jgi:hypothetical protein
MLARKSDIEVYERIVARRRLERGVLSRSIMLAATLLCARHVWAACGDGAIDAGEQCDVGDGNGLPGECCTIDCTIADAGSVCRPSSGPCDLPEACDGQAGICPPDDMAPAGTACATDDNPCTDDACDGLGACVHQANAAPCDDGNPCTIDDHCSEGGCRGTQPLCGDGVQGPCEACDDGALNGMPDSCCSATCTPRDFGTACGSDGDPCTQDACDGLGTCRHVAEPQPKCAVPRVMRGAKLKIRRRSATAAELAFTWDHGPAIDETALGDPTATATHVCLFDQRGAAYVPVYRASTAVPPSIAGRWTARSSGWKYVDRTAMPGTITGLTIKRSAVPLRSRIDVRAEAGAVIPELPFHLDRRMVVQLHSEAGGCWGATFAVSDRNDPASFSARSEGGSLEDIDHDGVVRVVCLGDSNTLPQGPPAPPPAGQGWCTRVASSMPEVVVLGPSNEDVPVPATFFSTGWGTAGAIETNNPAVEDGPEQVARATGELNADVLVMSFGSADLLRGQTPTDIWKALLDLGAQAGGRRVYTALVPPLYEPTCVPGLGVCESCPPNIDDYCRNIGPVQFNAKVREVNDLLRGSIPPGRLIDFYSIVSPQPVGTSGDFGDAVHFSALGQAKRAAQAEETLFFGY